MPIAKCNGHRGKVAACSSEEKVAFIHANPKRQGPNAKKNYLLKPSPFESFKKTVAAFEAQCHSERSEESRGIALRVLAVSKWILHFVRMTTKRYFGHSFN
jgi:hypothetical protein